MVFGGLLIKMSCGFNDPSGAFSLFCYTSPSAKSTEKKAALCLEKCLLPDM
jgi:hypothetical protein